MIRLVVLTLLFALFYRVGMQLLRRRKYQPPKTAGDNAAASSKSPDLSHLEIEDADFEDIRPDSDTRRKSE